MSSGCNYCHEKITRTSKLGISGEISVSDDDCVYCGICQELCPAEAIVVDNTTGQESIVIDKDKCVYCLVCKKIMSS